MRALVLWALFLWPMVSCAQDAPPVEGLIKQLGSADYRKRDVAMKALLERPDAEGPLRIAMQSKDPEIARRASSLVEEFEYRRSPLCKLDEAIASGHVELAIELIVACPEDKLDSAYWGRAQTFAKRATGGSADLGSAEAWELGKRRIKSPRVSAADFSPPLYLSTWIARAGEVDVQYPRTGKEWPSVVASTTIVFSTGRVRIHCPLVASAAIFANGDVEIDSDLVAGCFIVSGGNVTIHRAPVLNCVVIAKGSVTVHKKNYELIPHIVGGKKGEIFDSWAVVNTPRKMPHQTLILEKQANPLGYIRWRKEAKPRLEKK